MKTTIKKSTYQAIYRLLNMVSPLSTDCGDLCDASCCKDTNENLGIYLYPSEEKIFTRKETWLKWEVENAEDFEFPDSWKGKIYFVKCNGVEQCMRDLRPLQCRFFPLSPHITIDGKLNLIRYQDQLPYNCPLIQEKIALDQKFLKATYTVFRRLIKDQLIFDLIYMDSRNRTDIDIEILYPYQEI